MTYHRSDLYIALAFCPAGWDWYVTENINECGYEATGRARTIEAAATQAREAFDRLTKEDP